MNKEQLWYKIVNFMYREHSPNHLNMKFASLAVILVGLMAILGIYLFYLIVRMLI